MPDVRQLLPHPGEVDPNIAHAAIARPASPGRPWLLVNMVASIDGAATHQGVSDGLGGPADKRVFSAIRAVADVILVGAETIRTEAYGPPRTTPQAQAERSGRGQARLPRIAVISRSLKLDANAAWLTRAPEPPLVYTVPHAATADRAELRARAEVVEVAGDGVDPTAVLVDLYERGARVVLAEGGPSLNGQLVAAGLVDEVNLTIGPLLVGGTAPRIAHGPAAGPTTAMTLVHLWEQDGLLFARYRRT